MGDEIPEEGWKLPLNQFLLKILNFSFASAGLTVFDGFLHMHKYGVSTNVEQFRNGKELPILAGRRVFHQDYQYFQDTNERKIERGDILKLNCVYDTSISKEAVYGGLGAANEMCFFYFFYYPKMEHSINRHILTISRKNFVICNSRIESVPLDIVHNSRVAIEERANCQIGYLNITK